MGKAGSLGDALTEIVGEFNDIVPALGQGRHAQRHDAQAIVEIFAEVAGINLSFQVLRRRCHHAHIHADIGAAADALEALLGQDAEDFVLRADGHVGDFIEQERAGMGALEQADAHGAAGLVFLAEEGDLHLVGCDAGGIDHHKGAVCAAGILVDEAGGKFFADTGRAGNQDARIGWRDLVERGAQGGGCLAVADPAFFIACAVAQRGVLIAQGSCLNGALHDAAITASGYKRYFDSVRPISAIRYMASLGQRSDPNAPSYHPDGLLLTPGMCELVTESTTMPGQRHSALAGHEGEIAVLSWPGVPADAANSYSGVRWVLGTEWMPYQRGTFVTPPFAGYVSGHSTFSRTAAEVLTRFTGSEYFPGGLAEFTCTQNEFLVFEDGPSETFTFQWATYYDAADNSGISRLYGGIHPDFDDLPARRLGAQLGAKAYARASQLFDPSSNGCPADIDADATVGGSDLALLLNNWGGSGTGDLDGDGVVQGADLAALLNAWGSCR